MTATSAETTVEDLPVLDHDLFHQLTFGDDKLATELIELFRERVALMMPSLRSQVAAGDHARVKALAHDLRGSLAIFGAAAAMKAASEIETAASAQHRELASFLEDFKAEMKRVDRALKGLLPPAGTLTETA
jgi:HPt (histidine-containing phosphotransfer) domain-containing protein